MASITARDSLIQHLELEQRKLWGSQPVEFYAFQVDRFRLHLRFKFRFNEHRTRWSEAIGICTKVNRVGSLDGLSSSLVSARSLGNNNH